MVQEELCLVALTTSTDAYKPDHENDSASLTPLADFKSKIFIDETTGFKAVVYSADNGDGSHRVIVAFAGTEDGQDMIADLSLGWGQWQENRDKIFDYLKDFNPSEIVFTGHSLGGALAQYATYEYLDNYGKDSGAQVSLVTFNALGGLTGLETNIEDFDLATLSYFDTAHFVVEGDFVSRLGDGHLGNDIYLLRRVYTEEEYYFNPLHDQLADYVDNMPFDLISGHRLETVKTIVDAVGFQNSPAYTPDYLDISHIHAIATMLTLTNYDASHQIESTAAINLLAAGLSRTFAYVAALPDDDPGRVQFKTLIKELGDNIRIGADSDEPAGRILGLLIGSFDWVSLASIPIINSALDHKAFTTKIEVLLADAMSHTDNKLGAEGVNAFASLLIDYAKTVGVELEEIDDGLRDRLVNRFAEGIMFDEINVAGMSRLLTTVLDTLLPGGIDPATPVNSDGFFQIGGNALIAGVDTSPHSLFGSDGNDILLGQSTVTEVFYGNGGDDLMFGGPGVDFIIGGPGNDWLVGGDHDDELAGGADDDRLEDGPGRDKMYGGTGFDTYVLADDGEMDTIVDEDGLGVILFDGDELHGGTSVDGSSTHFSDGVHDYRIEGTDLVIDDTVTVRDWQPGQLDIALGGAPTPPELNLIIGSEGSDSGETLSGTDGDDAIYGLGGDDDLSGGLGDDQLFGGLGDDWLAATPGNDLLDGGDGNDVLISGIGHDRLLGGNGDDFLSAGDGNDRLDGGADTDVLAAGAGNDILYGGDGDDRLYGDGTLEPLNRNWSVSETLDADGLVISVVFDQTVGAATSAADGSDLIHGGGGDDVLIAGGGDDQLFGDAGNDYLDGGAGHDLLDGGDGDDSLHGDARLGATRESDGMDSLSGGAGNDWLEGGYGNDLLDGGDGNDELHGDYLDDPLVGGHDLLDGGAGDDLLLGGAGNDTIYGGPGIDRVDAGHGDDRVWGGSGADTLLGDAGDDLLHGEGGDDLIYGGDGNDGIDGGADHDRLEGEAGNDHLLGGPGDDLLLGGDGDDRLEGEDGQDLIDGGAGADRLAGGDGNDHLQAGSGDDWLDGGAGDDAVLGQEGHDELHGGDGHDNMAGGSGNDRLFGEAGNDQLWGQEDDDQLDGGPGDDILAGGTGHDTLVGGADHDQLYGEDGDDHLDGGDGDDLLAGGYGNDLLQGGAGSDQVHGEYGDDWLGGGAGADLLVGGPGNDTLTGGTGDDDLRGGSGSDLLRGGPGSDLLAGGSGNDRYLFEAGDGQVRIVEQGDTLGDTLQFGVGLAPDDFLAGRDGDDLVLQHRTGDERITVTGWFASTYNRLQSIGFSDGTTWTAADLASASTTVLGSHGDDLLVGDQRAETLAGLGGADQLDGMAGDDTLLGGPGDDLLRGGAGSDRLSGGAGSDRFLFAGGDGHDRLLDAEPGDALEFAPGITPAGVAVAVTWSTDGHQLGLLYGDGDRVDVGDGLSLDTLALQFEATGATLTLDDLIAAAVQRDGYLAHQVEPGAGPVTGTAYADLVTGSAGADHLLGAAGDDRLDGGGGADILAGGSGADQLIGGAGSDTYRYDRGQGHDTLIETSRVEGSVIELGPGLAEADLLWQRDGDSLVLEVADSGETLTYVDWWFRRDVAPLEVRFADGTALSAADLDRKIKTGTEGSDTLRSNPHPERLQGLGGDDRLLGKGGDDVLVGGSGNDLLEGGDGSDSYLFAAGWGADLLVEEIDDPLATDRVLFGSGMQPLDLGFSRAGDDLLVARHQSGDSVRIGGWFVDGASIEAFHTSDGAVLASDDVNRLIESMASFTATTGLDWSDAVDQQPDEVRALLAGYWETTGAAA
jgi:Ca2+-binding RTX toxin-like protein